MTTPLIERLEKMLAQGTDSALLHFSLANEWLKLEGYQEAIAHLQQVLALDAQYSAAWKLLGKAYTADNQIEAAIKTYQVGMAVAKDKGDLQAAKEMEVFLKRLR